MPIPDYQTIMLPLLKFMGDGKEYSIGESVEHISDLFKLSPEERKTLLPSGKQKIISNRVGWARTYLGKACLLEAVRKGYVRISQRGKEVLKKNPPQINNNYLIQFPEYVKFRSTRNKPKKVLKVRQATINDSLDPKERLENAFEVFAGF